MTRDSTRLIGGIVVFAVVVVGFVVLEVIDRLTESPGMRRRVNEGSDKFLAERGTLWQAASCGALMEFDVRCRLVREQ